jgi:hypothetical protein
MKSLYNSTYDSVRVAVNGAARDAVLDAANMRLTQPLWGMVWHGISQSAEYSIIEIIDAHFS